MVGPAGTVQVYVYDDSGDYYDLAVNELGKSGNGSTVEHDAGKYYLDVNANCDWSITVTG
jgi:hypothetical protein